MGQFNFGVETINSSCGGGWWECAGGGGGRRAGGEGFGSHRCRGLQYAWC